MLAMPPDSRRMQPPGQTTRIHAQGELAALADQHMTTITRDGFGHPTALASVEAHVLAISALKFGADALAGAVVVCVGGDQCQPGGRSFSQAASNDPSLGCCPPRRVDCHMAEGIPPCRWVKHHRQRFAPAAQSQPVESLISWPASMRATWPARGSGAGSPGDGSPGTPPGVVLIHLRRLIEAAVPPHPAGRVRADHDCTGSRRLWRRARCRRLAPHHIAAGGTATPPRRGGR